MNNIAHIIKDLTVGGIQTLMLDTLRFYEKSNQEFLLIIIGDGELRPEFLKFKSHCVFLKKRLPFLDPILIFQIIRIIKSYNIQVLHAHHISEGIAAYFLKLFSNVKYVQSFHSAPEICSKTDNFIFRKLSKKVDAGIVPSNYQLQKLKAFSYAISKFSIVNNGLDIQRFANNENSSFREKLKIEDDVFLMGMIGNFYNSTRDQLTICKALPKVFSAIPNSKFIFVGGFVDKYNNQNSTYEKCYEFCKDNNILKNVIFQGVDFDNAAILNALDLFVYSSLNDTFGIAVFEAILSKIPVVVNDLDVFKELLTEDNFLRFFPTGNHSILAEILIDSYKNESAQITENTKVYNYVIDNFSINNYISKLNLIYSEL